MKMGTIYRFISGTVWVIVFIGAWIYCTNEYGFLLGFGLGWLPAALSATIAALLWPVGVLAGAGVGGLVVYESHQKKPTLQATPPVALATQPTAQNVLQTLKPQTTPAAANQGWEDAKAPPTAPPPSESVRTSVEALNLSFWNASRKGDRVAANRMGAELYSRLETGLSKATAAGDAEAVNEINLLRRQVEDALRSLQSSQ